MLDLISIGDTAVDMFLELDEASVSCDINRDACLLCLNYADKIPVRAMTKIAGVGNAANVAVGSTRLGLKSALYTVLGNDDHAKDCVNRLKSEKVSTQYIHFDAKHLTNYATVLLFQGERTLLSHHEPRTYSLPKLSKAHWLYYTAIGAVNGVVQRQVIRYAKESTCRVAFNPGEVQLRQGLAVLKPLLAATEVLFVNKQEAERLLGRKFTDVKLMLHMLQSVGPRNVVVTDAENGSFACEGDVNYQCSIVPVTMKERTGAGDAYATGYLAARQYGLSVPEALQWGAVNAASVVQFVGAQAGLLNKRTMEQRVKKARLQVKKI